MEKYGFQLTYTGEILNEHEMDCELFGKSVLAIGKLIKESNKTLYDDKSKIEIKVKGTPRQGSLEINFVVIFNQLVTIFSSTEFNALTNLLAVIGISTAGIGGGLIGLYKWLKENRINKITPKENGLVEISTKEGLTKEFDSEILRLNENDAITECLGPIIANPLYRDGIDGVKIKGENDDYVMVNKEERDFFVKEDFYSDEEDAQTITNDVILRANKIWFEKGKKWSFRYSDNENIITARILDEDFVNKISKDEISFKKKDTFKVRLRWKRMMLNGKPKDIYEILKVIEHKPYRKTLNRKFKF